MPVTLKWRNVTVRAFLLGHLSRTQKGGREGTLLAVLKEIHMEEKLGFPSPFAWPWVVCVGGRLSHTQFPFAVRTQQCHSFPKTKTNPQLPYIKEASLYSLLIFLPCFGNVECDRQSLMPNWWPTLGAWWTNRELLETSCWRTHFLPRPSFDVPMLWHTQRKGPAQVTVECTCVPLY